MLGVIIGVTSVLIMIGIGSGATANITASIEGAGTNLLIVINGGSGGWSNTPLTMSDVAVLDDPNTYPDLAQVAPWYMSNATLTHGSKEGSYEVVGATPNYESVSNLELAAGKFITVDQIANKESVVILGATTARDIFGRIDPMGQMVRINNNAFRVVGLLAEMGDSGFLSTDTQAFVPLSVAQGRLFNAYRYRGSYTIAAMSIQVADSNRIENAEKQIEQVLRLRHNLAPDDENDFQVINQADLLDLVGTVTTALSALLGGIGSISLLVGGIGIMNIMLVTVTERTREIGLRKAVGARSNDILLQFLIEALLLTTFGGLIGIALSYGIAYLLSLIPAIPFALLISPGALTLAVAVSAGSGLLFGLYPAWRATKLDPIDALRYE